MKICKHLSKGLWKTDKDIYGWRAPIVKRHERSKLSRHQKAILRRRDSMRGRWVRGRSIL